jgi:hypothetical protein
MKKIIRLTERDLGRIVRQVIRENSLTQKSGKIKKIIKNNFEIDFNGKIKEINRYSEIPKSFLEKYLSLNTPKAFQDKIKFGQMYLIDVYKDKVINKKYLYQSGSDLMDQDGEFWSENQLMGLLGLNLMGLNINDLIDIYYESIYDI